MSFIFKDNDTEKKWYKRHMNWWMWPILIAPAYILLHFISNQ